MLTLGDFAVRLNSTLRGGDGVAILCPWLIIDEQIFERWIETMKPLWDGLNGFLKGERRLGFLF